MGTVSEVYGAHRAGFVREGTGPAPASLESSAMPVRRPVYADHHATTPLRPEALEAMLPWLTSLAANPSSIHAPGRAARKAVESAREAVASALGVLPDEIVFTSGGTESDTLAVRGAALAAREREPGRSRVVFSAAEHAAVREAGLSLAADGFEPVEVPVDGAGLPGEDGLASALDARTALVSLILASNETGVVNVPTAGRGQDRARGRRRRPHGRRPGRGEDPGPARRRSGSTCSRSRGTSSEDRRGRGGSG